jgi:hypothetical protein
MIPSLWRILQPPSSVLKVEKAIFLKWWLPPMKLLPYPEDGGDKFF